MSASPESTSAFRNDVHVKGAAFVPVLLNQRARHSPRRSLGFLCFMGMLFNEVSSRQSPRPSSSHLYFSNSFSGPADSNSINVSLSIHDIIVRLKRVFVPKAIVMADITASCSVAGADLEFFSGWAQLNN